MIYHAFMNCSKKVFLLTGEGRGLGLSTLKEIADNADNVLLDTIIENGFFIQKVEIINN